MRSGRICASAAGGHLSCPRLMAACRQDPERDFKGVMSENGKTRTLGFCHFPWRPLDDPQQSSISSVVQRQVTGKGVVTRSPKSNCVSSAGAAVGARRGRLVEILKLTLPLLRRVAHSVTATGHRGRFRERRRRWDADTPSPVWSGDLLARSNMLLE